MTVGFARVGEHNLASARVHVPAQGPWFADVVFERDPDVSGRVSLWLGGTELVGTIAARHDGVTGLQRRSRIVAGGGGWATLLEAHAYHNDARIRARTIAEDAARIAGEQLGDFAPADERVGIDYVRQAGPASRVLEDVIGGVPWWVGYDGRTNVGTRPGGAAAGYELLEVGPAERVAVLAADELGELLVGTTIAGEQLEDEPVIRELAIDVEPEQLRVRAWYGGGDDSHGKLVDSLLAIIEKVHGRRLYGLWRYRVVQMSGDRVELQAVRRAAGLPDVLPVSMWPGVAGAHAEPAGSGEVLVQFVEGDRTMPVVTHFAGKDGQGWTPVKLTLDVVTELLLGAGATNFVALANLVKQRIDTIQTAFDAHTHATPSGTSDPPGTTIGALAGVAASKVKAE